MSAAASTPPDAVTCSAVRVGYGTSDVIDGLDLTVRRGEMVALLGPSGSGKSTLLAAIAGFHRIRDGEIRIDGRVVADARRHEPPERRDVAVVFQGNALWPHLSAVDTIAYPARRRGLGAHDARAEALGVLDRVGLRQLADRRPAELSGGEQQRVGLGRAIARKASLQLFDEPTAHLDAALREQLLDLLTTERRAAGATGLYATHDTSEALALADRVALIRDGRIVQEGTPAELYDAPTDVWAARLTGPAVDVEVTIVDRTPDGRVELAIGTDRILVEAAGSQRGDVLPGQRRRAIIRPDWVTLGGPLSGVVERVAFRGTHTDVRLSTPVGPIGVRTLGHATAQVGEAVGWSLQKVHLLPFTTDAGPARSPGTTRP